MEKDAPKESVPLFSEISANSGRHGVIAVPIPIPRKVSVIATSQTEFASAINGKQTAANTMPIVIAL